MPRTGPFSPSSRPTFWRLHSPKDQDGGLGIHATVRAAIDVAESRIGKSFANQPMVEASIRDTLGESYVVLGEPASRFASSSGPLRYGGPHQVLITPTRCTPRSNSLELSKKSAGSQTPWRSTRRSYLAAKPGSAPTTATP